MSRLSELQAKLVELDRRKEEIKQYYEELHNTIDALVEEQGVNSYFQDTDGTVFKMVECDGKWVKFEKYGYQRTRRQGEERASLPLKDARAAGYSVE